MTGLSCVNCRRDIAAADVNIAADIAKCSHCGTIFQVSAAMECGGTPPSFDLNSPPSGVKFLQTPTGFTITASTRSSFAFYFVPFMLVWSGLSLGALYVEPVLSGKNVILFWFIGLPFLSISIVLNWAAMMMVFGKVRIVADGYKGSVFTGIGFVGLTKHFSWLDIDLIRIGIKRSSRVGKECVQIYLEGKDRIGFGGDLSEERKYYVLHALRSLLGHLRR